MVNHMMKFLILLCLLASHLAWAAYSPETIITDPTGSNQAAVKAASTAPQATDPALVVAISPNSPLGATSDRADASVTPGAAPTASILIGGQFNSSLPSLLNGQVGALQSDSSGRLFSSQGGAAGLSGAWPFKLTDGTNTMPTMDAASRKGFFQPTDGTNLMPMMDAGVRAGFFKLTDGTNLAPTMDSAARAGFQKITDGTNTASVTASSALKVDGSAVTQPVSGTFWQATQPVSSTQLPAALDGSGFLKVHEQGTASVSISGNAGKTYPNANAAFSQTSVTTTASTISAPSNAVRVIIQGDSGNTDCIRYRFDGTAATSTVGMVAQPGQDSGQLDSGMSVSVAACSGTQKVNVQYFAQ